MHRVVHRLVLSGCLIAVLVVAGCGDDDGGDDGDASPAELTGSSFEVTAVEGQELAAGSTIRLTFEDDLILVEAGCNSMRGGYTIEDGVLQVGVLAGTQMACDEALMAQDQWVAAFLEGGPALEQDGDRLVLSDATTRMELAEVG